MKRDAHPSRTPSDTVAAGTVSILVALLMLWTWRHDRPGEPVGRDAPSTAFSALRALDALTRVLGDDLPHPTGSFANREVRQRLEAELSRIGYEPEVQSRFSCNAEGTCAQVENVLTKLTGRGGTPGVLLVAHYDSVPAAPGASDDGAGVATLIEVARALRAQPRLARDVWFLFTDGEELHLLGAEAFVREPEFQRIGVVVNFEARGTTGRSRLIETSDGNAGLIAQLGTAMSSPSANSLTPEIYDTLPNDTDLTVFRRTGVASLGFAFAEGAERYHTLRDDLEHLDRGSLQGHGDHALALAREFAAHGVEKSAHDAVFFDLFGMFVVWPQAYNLPLLLVAFGAFVALLARLGLGGQVRASQGGIAVLLSVGIPVGALALGVGLHLALFALGALPSAWTAQATELVAAFMLLPIALLALLGRPLARRLSPHALAAASVVPFACIAVATVFFWPGGSFVGLLPWLVGMVAANLRPERPVIWGGALAVGATPVFFNIAAAAYGALGHAALPGVSLVLAIGMLPLLVVFAALGALGRMLGTFALVGCVGAAASAVLLPALTRDTPAGTMLMFISDPEAARLHAFIGTERMPPAFAAAGGFAQEPRVELPGLPTPIFVGRPGSRLEPPRLELVADAPTPSGRRLELQLRSRRGASQGSVLIEPSAGLVSAAVQGTPVPKPAPGKKSLRTTRNPWRMLSARPLSPGGARFTVELRTRDAVRIFFSDMSFGLPDEHDAVASARAPHVVPIHTGDFAQSWSVLTIPASQAAHATARLDNRGEWTTLRADVRVER